MKIEITYTKEEIRKLIAEHCRYRFKIFPKNVEILLSSSVDQYIAKVEGEYKPEV